jgi:MFS family permease
VASNVLNPAIIGDIFPSEQRGGAMSVVMLAPLLGGAVGPAISGAIAETMGWRQTMWLAIGLAIVCEIAFLTMFRETYKVTVLAKMGKPIAENTDTPAPEEEDLGLVARFCLSTALWSLRFSTSCQRLSRTSYSTTTTFRQP